MENNKTVKDNNEKKVMLKEAGILFAITLIAGLVLGFVYELTKDPIRLQEEKAIQEACRAVFAEAADFEELNYTPRASMMQDLAQNGVEIGTVYEAQDVTGEGLGYVVQSTTSEGYGGDIQVMVGISVDGTVQGVDFLTINETVGFGLNAKEPEFKDQFVGKQVLAFEYTKTGATGDSQIDAISGATITTSAVVDAINAAVMIVNLLGGV